MLQYLKQTIYTFTCDYTAGMSSISISNSAPLNQTSQELDGDLLYALLPGRLTTCISSRPTLVAGPELQF